MTDASRLLTLVLGGTGRTGRRVVGRLVQRGERVRVLSRHADGPRAPGVEWVRGDLAAFDPAVLEGTAGVVISVEPPYDAVGADAVLHRGVADLAAAVAGSGVPVVLVSQIYITRPDAHPQMRDVISARARGERALRASGARYGIVRPGWLTDEPFHGVRLEQGDTGEGQVSREAVAEACVQVLDTPAAHGRTFEVFDGTHGAVPPPDWPRLLGALAADAEARDAR